MSETDKQPAVPPAPTGAKAKRFGVGFVRILECCFLTGILLAILIFIVPRFCDSLAELSADVPALTVVVMSASAAVRNRLYVFVPLAGAVVVGLLVLPFVCPPRLTVVVGTVLLIAVTAATVAVLLGIYLSLMGLYGAGLK